MKLAIADNIRTFRKQKSMTQEQLAEMLGVTVGAVYKWESGQSLPELNMIVELADFFDTSVDVLLGYQMKDNSLSSTLSRLREYRRNNDQAGLTEVEKALKKYPNNFEVVNESALLYGVIGMGNKDKNLLNRSLELLNKSILLLPQNTNPQVSEFTIYGLMANIYACMDEPEKSVELMKKYNVGGIHNALIGTTLANDCHRIDEAEPFLSEALLQGVSTILNAVSGYTVVFFARGDFRSAQDILQWCISLFSALKKEDSPGFIDKGTAILLTSLAYAQLENGNEAAARASLENAAELARRFDASPDYSAKQFRFVMQTEKISLHDFVGKTAADGINATLEQIKNENLNRIWKELTSNEN